MQLPAQREQLLLCQGQRVQLKLAAVAALLQLLYLRLNLPGGAQAFLPALPQSGQLGGLGGKLGQLGVDQLQLLARLLAVGRDGGCGGSDGFLMRTACSSCSKL